MSEPKTMARSVTEVVPGLFHYTIEDERIKTQSHGYALVAYGKVALIDFKTNHRSSRLQTILQRLAAYWLKSRNCFPSCDNRRNSGQEKFLESFLAKF